jgi:Bifunctional DNA primase/polymerase, N-terminal
VLQWLRLFSSPNLKVLIDMTPLDAAIAWIQKGFSPVSIPHRSKRRILKGWEELEITADVALQYFNGNQQNMGVHLGDRYGSADVDCDCSEAITIARALLPATGLIFGRQSKPSSHFFYRPDPPLRTSRYVDPLDRKTIVELRGLSADGSAGLQTVVPPSIHETGESIRFEDGFDRDPANVDAPVLQTAVKKVAAAALLARHWPRPGAGRHATMLCLAGVLHRTGWAQEDAVQLCRAVYQAPDHDRYAITRTESEVRDTFRNAAAGRVVTGTPTLQGIFDKRVVSKVLEWLRAERRAPEPDPQLAEDNQTQHRDYHWNDTGNADRLADLYGHELIYCTERNSYYVWTLAALAV